MTSGTPGDALPEGLMKRLKQGLGSHIKRNYFTYYKVRTSGPQHECFCQTMDRTSRDSSDLSSDYARRISLFVLQAVGHEVANINKVMKYQEGGMRIVNSIIMALMVGLLNYLASNFLDENSLNVRSAALLSLPCDAFFRGKESSRAGATAVVEEDRFWAIHDAQWRPAADVLIG